MFIGGFDKIAFFGFGKKKEEKQIPITKEHEKYLMPAFKRHDKLRKKGDFEHPDNLKLVHRVVELEEKTGIPNEQLYSHMYKRYGFDKESSELAMKKPRKETPEEKKKREAAEQTSCGA